MFYDGWMRRGHIYISWTKSITQYYISNAVALRKYLEKSTEQAAQTLLQKEYAFFFSLGSSWDIGFFVLPCVMSFWSCIARSGTINPLPPSSNFLWSCRLLLYHLRFSQTEWLSPIAFFSVIFCDTPLAGKFHTSVPSILLQQSGSLTRQG